MAVVTKPGESAPAEHDLSSLRIHDRSRQGKTGKRLGLFAAALGVLVLVTGAYFTVRGQRPEVEVATARSGQEARTAPALLNASGYVTPRRRATVAAKVTGLVTQVFAEEGMHVKAGQVLATLDCSQPDAALSSARADRQTTQASLLDFQVQLANAEIELKRAEGLVEAKIGTPQARDTAQTLVDSLKARIAYTREQVKSADARIDVAQQDVENCTVRSPYDGIVVSKDAQRGEIVSPISAGGGFTRTGIATVVDMSSNEIEVDVSESFIARVTPDQKVVATLDAYPDWQIPSHVRTVIPTADRQKATVKVRISFDKLDPRILPDMGVKVAFLADEPKDPAPKTAPKAIIPKGAVRDDNGAKIVLLVRDGKLERRAVTLGPERGGDVEVLAGVTAGDVLVLHGPENLREGQSVEIKK
jgi:RND family efflux transporter MFP subunit